MTLCVYAKRMQVPEEARRSSVSLKVKFAGRCWELRSGPLEKQQVLLLPELSLPPLAVLDLFVCQFCHMLNIFNHILSLGLSLYLLFC